jgi:hypothetical protein
MTDTANILDMNEDELIAQFKARDRIIESIRQQLAECQAQNNVLRDALQQCAYDEEGFCINPDAAEALEHKAKELE